VKYLNVNRLSHPRQSIQLSVHGLICIFPGNFQRSRPAILSNSSSWASGWNLHIIPGFHILQPGSIGWLIIEWKGLIDWDWICRRLDSNALICDCQMLWLAQMLNEKQGTTLAAATCEYPAKLHGKPVSSLVDNFICSKSRLMWPECLSAEQLKARSLGSVPRRFSRLRHLRLPHFCLIKKTKQRIDIQIIYCIECIMLILNRAVY